MPQHIKQTSKSQKQKQQKKHHSHFQINLSQRYKTPAKLYTKPQIIHIFVAKVVFYEKQKIYTKESKYEKDYPADHCPCGKYDMCLPRTEQHCTYVS
jgi:hypothetical protein